MTSSSSQRVKVGLIGLAVVILLIGLASAVMRSVTRDRPVAVAGSAKQDVVANLAAADNTSVHEPAPTDPVSDLGVAPSVGNAQAGSQ